MTLRISYSKTVHCKVHLSPDPSPFPGLDSFPLSLLILHKPRTTYFLTRPQIQRFDPPSASTSRTTTTFNVLSQPTPLPEKNRCRCRNFLLDEKSQGWTRSPSSVDQTDVGQPYETLRLRLPVSTFSEVVVGRWRWVTHTSPTTPLEPPVPSKIPIVNLLPSRPGNRDLSQNS